MVRRILLSPAWLAGHLLVLVAFATCLWLGWWQLSRFESATGGAQNAGYALQWPLFGLFALFFWWRVIRAELRPPEQDRPDGEPPGRSRPPRDRGAGDRPGRGRGGRDRGAGDRPATRLAARTQIGLDESADPELAAYNRYLAELHAADASSERGE